MGTIPHRDPTIGSGSPFFGAGTHHPMALQAQFHLRDLRRAAQGLPRALGQVTRDRFFEEAKEFDPAGEARPSASDSK